MNDAVFIGGLQKDITQFEEKLNEVLSEHLEKGPGRIDERGSSRHMIPTKQSGSLIERSSPTSHRWYCYWETSNVEQAVIVKYKSRLNYQNPQERIFLPLRSTLSYAFELGDKWQWDIICKRLEFKKKKINELHEWIFFSRSSLSQMHCVSSIREQSLSAGIHISSRIKWDLLMGNISWYLIPLTAFQREYYCHFPPFLKA